MLVLTWLACQAADPGPRPRPPQEVPSTGSPTPVTTTSCTGTPTPPLSCDRFSGHARAGDLADVTLDGLRAVFGGASADLDLDGELDLVVGSVEGGAGDVHVFLGPFDPALEPSMAAVHFAGRGVDRLGEALVTADGDGDGATDLWIAAPGMDGTPEVSAGRVYFVPGPITAETDLETAVWLTGDPETAARIGTALEAGPDLTGDGTADLLVGDDWKQLFVVDAPPTTSGPLTAHAAATIDGNRDVGGILGASLDDADGDGVGDLVVARAAYPWTADLLLGPFSGAIDAHGTGAATVTGVDRTPGFPIGTFVYPQAAGDADGDGRSDFWIGEPEGGLEENGLVHLFSGTARGALGPDDALAEIVGGYPYAEAGRPVTAGDLDGDGAQDAVIWGHRGDVWSPSAWVVYGPLAGSHDLADADAVFKEARPLADEQFRALAPDCGALWMVGGLSTTELLFRVPVPW